jgi:hypothetical protein
MSISKKYKIARAGTELGVFDLSAMAEGLKSGRFAWSDDCWGEGDVKWGKLSDIAAAINAVRSSPAAAVSAQVASTPASVASAAAPVVQSPRSGLPSWLAYGAFVSVAALLALVVFGLFRQTKWEYHLKTFVFPDSEYITLLQSPPRWEYTYVSVPARSARYTTMKADREGHDAMSAAQIDRDKLKSLTEDMTKEGWELAGTAMEIETAYPNFGKDEYVTGLRENVRPQALLMVFRKAIAIDHARMGVGRKKQDDMIQAYCTRMGEDGWELVSSLREVDANVVLSFKRPKR